MDLLRRRERYDIVKAINLLVGGLHDVSYPHSDNAMVYHYPSSTGKWYYIVNAMNLLIGG